MPKRLYLLRHGSTGLDGRLVGSSDVPVAPAAVAVLQNSGRTLRGMEPEAVLCSPMLRCRQSVAELGLSCEPEIHEDLREIDFGQWENKTFQEIVSHYPDEVREWNNWSEDFTCPGGERIGDFLRRVRSIRDKLQAHPAKSLLVVTHGGVIRHLICLLLRLAPENYLLFEVKAGCFATVDLYSQGGVLSALNAQ